MADIALTTARVNPVFSMDAEILPMIAAVAITAGDAVAIDSSGTAVLADASAAQPNGFRGIALEDAGIGQAFSLLKRGGCEGFTVAGVAYDAQLFLSDTAGALADAAGTVTVQVGRVFGLTDSGTSKIVYIDSDWSVE